MIRAFKPHDACNDRENAGPHHVLYMQVMNLILQVLRSTWARTSGRLWRTNRMRALSVFLDFHSCPQRRTRLHRLYTGAGPFPLARFRLTGAQSIEDNAFIHEGIGRGLPAVRRHGLEERHSKRRSARDPRRLPPEGARPVSSGIGAYSEALRAL